MSAINPSKNIRYVIFANVFSTKDLRGIRNPKQHTSIDNTTTQYIHVERITMIIPVLNSKIKGPNIDANKNRRDIPISMTDPHIAIVFIMEYNF
jgi:hypothetical protein